MHRNIPRRLLAVAARIAADVERQRHLIVRAELTLEVAALRLGARTPGTRVPPAAGSRWPPEWHFWGRVDPGATSVQHGAGGSTGTPGESHDGILMTDSRSQRNVGRLR